jgi:hypothetical protein
MSLYDRRKMVRRAVDRITHRKESCLGFLFYGTLAVLVVETAIGLFTLISSLHF